MVYGISITNFHRQNVLQAKLKARNMMKQYFVLLLMSGTICMASESELISTHAMNRQLPDNSRKKLLAQHLTAALAITDTTQALQAVEDLLRIPKATQILI